MVRGPVVRDGDRRGVGQVRRELEEYFSGRRSAFDVPVEACLMTPFQRHVPTGLREEVPFGEVIPYGQLAERIGRAGAARAVGRGLGRNPVAIVVPCHRVVRSDGSLGGYMGGVEFNRRLLALEGREDLATATAPA